METITLTGRNSRLSLIQTDLVKAKIESAFPGIQVKVKPCTSRGDRLQNIPLQTMEGTDFFTEEVFEKLKKGEADIAVHSLKDMSAEHFFGGNHFGVVDRDEVRDVAIFNSTIVEQLKNGLPIKIGTCSPRREIMATRFLKDALPQRNANVFIGTKFIRGNVDTRLNKLNAGEYDGIILAAAGLNRLLRKHEHAQTIFPILSNKKIMMLPIFECTPAPCQGAIVAEVLSNNTKAIEVLQKINNPELLAQCEREKRIALKYGAGCDQKFGVTTISYANQKSQYAAGEDGNRKHFKDWYDLPNIDRGEKVIWDGSIAQRDNYTEDIKLQEDLNTPVIFVSNYNAIQKNFIPELNKKRVWAAGTKTWNKLAKEGIWVEGCSDGLGLESLEKVWGSPLINIQMNQVTILTNDMASKNWRTKNWKAIGTYRAKSSIESSKKISTADMVFWSSSFQFHSLKHLTKSNATHACASGETSKQLQHAGIVPIIFPTIQSFQQWKTRATLSPIEG